MYITQHLPPQQAIVTFAIGGVLLLFAVLVAKAVTVHYVEKWAAAYMERRRKRKEARENREIS